MFKKTILISAIAAMTVLAIPFAANAGERRAGNTAMGAAAGFVVGGPIGAVAGGAIGYVAGENIARGAGIQNKRYRYRYTQDGRRYRHYY